MIEWQHSFETGELAMLIDHSKNAVGLPQAHAIAKLAECPKVELQSNLYWMAYQELGNDRPQAMEGLASIPFSSIIAYADEYRFKGDERAEFKRIIREIDNREVRLVAEKRRKATAKHK